MLTETVKVSTVAAVTEITDWLEFIELAEEWNELATATSDLPFYRHEFFRIWLEQFGAGAKLKILILRNQAGQLTAALPLMSETTSMYGLPLQQLISTANPHSCRFDLLALDKEMAAKAFWLH